MKESDALDHYLRKIWKLFSVWIAFGLLTTGESGGHIMKNI